MNLSVLKQLGLVGLGLGFLGLLSVIVTHSQVASAVATITYSSNPATYTMGVLIDNNIPTVSDGGVYRYFVNPILPSGLSISSSTGIVSGTPLVLVSSSSFKVTAKNRLSQTSVNLIITINDQAPSNLIYSANPAIYTRGVAIPDNVPSNSGGAATSYSVSPVLPSGLSINSSTGIISGTPSDVVSEVSYVVTASNSGGSTSANVSITVVDLPLTDQLGTVTELPETCATGNPYGPCQVLEIKCDNMPALRAEIVVTEPSTSVPYKGTIIFGIGGSGTAFYRKSVSSKSLFSNLSAAGYRLIDRRWLSSWFGGAGGVRDGSCRYASLVTHLHEKYAASGGAFCGTGNSGGAGELLNSITHYGRDAIFDLVVPTGGPAITRLDYACYIPTDLDWLNQCQSLIASQNWLSPDINGVLGSPLSWEVAVSCTLPTNEGVCKAVNASPTVEQLREDSVLSIDARVNYPNTFVYSINGTEDSQISPAVGLLFNEQVTSSKLNVVVDSPHTINDDPEGATQIERAMKDYCIKF